MFKYRKKPVVIEAIKLSTLNGDETQELPRWLFKAMQDKVIYERGGRTFVETKEGPLACAADGWIIQGIEGELYPCDDQIFLKTYDKVEE